MISMRSLGVSLYLLPVVAACSVIGHERVAGWPKLEVVEHYVSYEQMLEKCQKYGGFGTSMLACAEFDFVEHKCLLWFAKTFAPRYVVEHERLHCQGYDHVGSNLMRQFLSDYYRHRSRP